MPAATAVQTSAQLLQFGKFEWYGNTSSGEEWGKYTLEVRATFAEKI
jgi:hypothetical protein